MSMPFWSAHLCKSICTQFKNMDIFGFPPEESNCKKSNAEAIWSMCGQEGSGMTAVGKHQNKDLAIWVLL